MLRKLLILVVFIFPFFLNAQIYLGDNGLTVTGTGVNKKIQLGGSLLLNTSFDLGATFTYNIKKGTANYLHILNNGNIGFGTNAPTASFDVVGASRFRNSLTLNYGTANRTVRLTDAGLFLSRTSDGTYSNNITANTEMLFNTDGNYRFINNAVERFTILQSGNVGIGTSTPIYNLDVNGNGRFSSDIYINAMTLGRGPGNMPQNVIIGYQSGEKNTTGANNVYIGYRNNYDINAINGSNNTFIGSAAGRNSQNNKSTFIGTFSGYHIVGDNNVAVGYYSGFQNIGSKNTFIGDSTGLGSGGTFTGSFNTFLGANITGLPSAISNHILISDGQGNIRFKDDNINTILPRLAGSGSRMVVAGPNGELSTQAISGGGGSGNWNLNGNNIVNANTGFVSIGTSANPAPTDPQLKLAVNGNIYAQKLKITQQGWADYVFEPTYKLMPLNELEAYINKNKHLPDVPSAVEVETKGLDLGDNQTILLQKIEELTLYVIELKKEIEALKVQHITKPKSK